MKKLFLLLFIGILFTSCTKETDIKLEKIYNYKLENKEIIKLSYINYDEITKKSSNESDEYAGRYSENTKDLKIKWNETDVYEENPNIVDLFKKITLNDRKIKLPTDFKSLGKEFIGFENINFNDFTDDKLPVNYKNTNSNYEITLLNKINNLDGSNAKKYISLVSNEDKKMCRLEISQLDKKIKVSGITTSIHNPYQSNYDLKINGIGIGNTLNEMYEKLGKPTIHSYKQDGSKTIFYIYKSIEDNVTYFIIFEHSNKSKDKINIKNNVITDVSVSYSIN